MRAETTREATRHLISVSVKDFEMINEMLIERQKIVDRIGALNREIEARGTNLYQLPDDHPDSKEWNSLLEEEQKQAKPIKKLFSDAVLRVFVFGKALPSYDKRIYNQTGIETFKEQARSLVMAKSHSRHMMLKVDWEQMKWLGFVWNKGWHYNGINYGM